MAKILPKDIRETLYNIMKLTLANPFTQERIDAESQLLGKTYAEEPLNFSNAQDRLFMQDINSFLLDFLQEIKPFMDRSSTGLDTLIRERYQNAVWFWVYHSKIEIFERIIQHFTNNPDHNPSLNIEFYREFRDAICSFLGDYSSANPLGMSDKAIGDLFAFCFQLWRGYTHILNKLLGRSPSIAQLRADVWETIFTRRLLWSYTYLKDRMANFSTLILGASGTGKDLVAEAIGKSQFISYSLTENRFAINFEQAYHGINLSALTPTLIESELFGHSKGAFTGADQSRKGLLEQCSAHGALFLDEIGDLHPEIQVKLLRVLQTRQFNPLGGGKLQTFHGRILSATNRDLKSLLAKGDFREDFLYRIGAVVIRVPTLDQRLQETPLEMEELLQHILRRILGAMDDLVYEELRDRIRDLLDTGYSWPGNVREFEQCVRSMLVTSNYQPLFSPIREPAGISGLVKRLQEVRVPLDELLAIYCRHAYTSTGSYQSAAKKVKADWRTIKKYAEIPLPSDQLEA